MNAYKPWELEGMSEEQFWRRKYIEVEMENGWLRAVVEAARKVVAVSEADVAEGRYGRSAADVELKAALEKVGGGE